jgi:type I restriction enzyme, S subunit
MSGQKVAKGYKQTEVGVIPEDWSIATAAEICDLVVDCKNRTPPIVDGGEFAVARTPNVRNGRFVLEELRFTDASSFREWTARAVPQVGDILITREAPLGEVCLVPSDYKVCLGQRMMLYRPDQNKTDSAFFLYSLMAPAVQSCLMKKIGGSTVGHAKVDDIRNLEIPIPPTIAEQKQIARALSDIDALIEGLEGAIGKKRQIKQGAMQELLRPKDGWVMKHFGDITEQIVGGGTPSRVVANYWNGNIPWMTVKDFAHHTPLGTLEYITHDGLKNSASNLIPRGTLITSTRMALGKAVIFDVDVSINQDLKAIFPKKDIDVRFLFFWFQFNERYIAEMGSGSTVMGISLGDLRKIVFAKPPKSEQVQIATILSDMDNAIATLEAKLTKTRQLKQGMMHELLTGRIRLV